MDKSQAALSQIVGNLVVLRDASAGPVSILLGARLHSLANRDAEVKRRQLPAAWHGHDEAVMRRIYSHADQAGMAAAAQALEAAWSGSKIAAL